MNGHYTIAIDGPSGAGKSTLARRAAKEFGFLYVDTGAIYRTLGLAAHRRGIDCHDEAAVSAILPELDIHMAYNDAGEQCMYLDGEDVSAAIRAPEISICAYVFCISIIHNGQSQLLHVSSHLSRIIGRTII